MAVLLCSLIGAGFFWLGLAEANIVMVFLLGVAYVAVFEGRGPAIAASIVSVLVVDFCFVPPYLTFAVSDTQYFITFGVMLGIGLLISTLTARVREQLRTTAHRDVYRRGRDLFARFPARVGAAVRRRNVGRTRADQRRRGPMGDGA
jgi:two-component system sensor histidine kinase KdpD